MKFEVRKIMDAKKLENNGKYAVVRVEDGAIWDGPFTYLSDAYDTCKTRNDGVGVNLDVMQSAKAREHDLRAYGTPVPFDVNPVNTEPSGGRFIDRLDSATRKHFPMSSGFVDYFPDAMAAVSHISWVGNQKHNKDQPLHWSRGKSNDHADCVIRHHSTRKDVDPAFTTTPIAEVAHLAERAWRAMAELQEAMERVYELDLPAGAKP